MTQKRAGVVLFLAILLVAFPPLSVSGANTTDRPQPTDIVWVQDVSGSFSQADPLNYWQDAVYLGADLAPVSTRMAYITVNQEITAETDFEDLSKTAGRNIIKQAVENTVINGDTNLLLGISRAVELLDSESSAASKHVFLVADICEGGFTNSPYSDASSAISEIGNITAKAKSKGIQVHLFFLSQPPAGFDTSKSWEKMAADTDGTLDYVDATSIVRTVQNRYFEQFAYTMIPFSGVNTHAGEQDFPIDIPQISMSRARIYVPVEYPLSTIKARGEGVEIFSVHNRSYTMLDMMAPIPSKIDMQVLPDDVQMFTIYLILDSVWSLEAECSSVAEEVLPADTLEPITFRQRVDMTILPKEESTSQMGLSAANGSVDWQLTMTDPDGISTDIDNAELRNGTLHYSFYPEKFGEYSFSLILHAGEERVAAAITTASIEPIELPAPIAESPPKELNWPMIIAIVVGGAIILAAVLYALLRHKPPRRKTYRKALSPDASLGEATFTGKLQFYGVTIEGGKAEIPPTAIQLDKLYGEKNISLAQALEMSGDPYHYQTAENIWLLPGTGNTLIVHNSSDAVIISVGRTYRRGQQLTLNYGQKFYLILEEGETEYEIYYHKTQQLSQDTQVKKIAI